MTTVDMKPISGHDGMANLCKPIMAYDLQVRYTKTKEELVEQIGLKFTVIDYALLMRAISSELVLQNSKDISYG